MAAEVPPTMGTIFGFRRSDTSWHGHKPFAGERRVVQVTWLRDASELERKKSRIARCCASINPAATRAISRTESSAGCR